MKKKSLMDMETVLSNHALSKSRFFESPRSFLPPEGGKSRHPGRFKRPGDPAWRGDCKGQGNRSRQRVSENSAATGGRLTGRCWAFGQTICLAKSASSPCITCARSYYFHSNCVCSGTGSFTAEAQRTQRATERF